MSRNMSFSLTTSQVLNHTKTVTRRKGWRFLKAGDRIMACEKCMGLGKDGKIKHLCEIEIVSNKAEPLVEIVAKPNRGRGARTEVELEGFPGMRPEEFVEMFCEHMRCEPATIVNRIEFKYVEPPVSAGACSPPPSTLTES